MLETIEHKPSRLDERMRIEKKFNGRVKKASNDENGSLRVYA